MIAYHNEHTVRKSEGESRNNLRIITNIARLLAANRLVNLDETYFWKEQIENRKQDPANLVVNPRLESYPIIMLTKLFVLEWSHELDHRLYEDFSLEFLVS